MNWSAETVEAMSRKQKMIAGEILIRDMANPSKIVGGFNVIFLPKPNVSCRRGGRHAGVRWRIGGRRGIGVLGLTNCPDRNDIRPGLRVRIIEKQNQRTGLQTEGFVARILTKSPSHPHGIKVMLTDGRVGRVQEVLPTRSDP